MTGEPRSGPDALRALRAPSEEAHLREQLAEAVDRIVEWSREEEAVGTLEGLCQGSAKAEGEFRDALARILGGPDR